MNRFLRHVILFFAVLTLIFSATYALNAYLFEQNQPLVSKDTRILLTGASRMSFGVNDVLIPNSHNIAMPEMSFVFHYHILKSILQNNPQIERIVLGASPTHVSAKVDYRFTQNINTKNMYNIMFPLLNMCDITMFPVRVKGYLKSFLRNKVVPNFLYISNTITNQDRLPYIGQYKDNCIAELGPEVVEKRLKRHFLFAGEQVGASQIDINFLDSIAALTALHDVELIFLAAPLHPAYRSEIPRDIEDAYRLRMSTLQNRHDHVAELNTMDWVFDDVHYIDGDHLNADGASIYTSQIEPLISGPIEVLRSE